MQLLTAGCTDADCTTKLLYHSEESGVVVEMMLHEIVETVRFKRSPRRDEP